VSQKVKSGPTPQQVLVAKWVSGGCAVVAVIVGVLVAILDWKVVIANGAFAVAIVAAFACIATIHARHITRHASACTKQAVQHTDIRVRELQENTEDGLYELVRVIKTASVFADHTKRWDGK
jgi:hypothetical protein